MPVTAEVVEEFLAATPRARTEIIAAMPNLDRACTVEQAAVNAAMAVVRRRTSRSSSRRGTH